jgi:nucleoside-diphosphate-sugar epimerase
MSSLSGVRVLVTGGTGFIGGRLVARLAHACGAHVRVLVRDLRRATQIARYPVDLFRGDLTDAAVVARAVETCEIVVHCAVGNQGTDDDRKRVTVGGTEHLLAAVASAGIRRFVHVSTAAVYGGYTPDSVLTEEFKPRRSGVQYVDSKFEAEEAVHAAARNHGFEAVICQPTIVYGPFARTFTTNVVQQLKTGRVILVNGGAGICNSVYVEDVVTALLLAATSGVAPGETFLVSGPDTVTWREFYERYQRSLGLADRLVSMTEAEARSYSEGGRQSRRWLFGEVINEIRTNTAYRERLLTTCDGSVLARGIRQVSPRFVAAGLKGGRVTKAARIGGVEKSQANLAIHPLHPSRIAAMASRSVVVTSKAQRLLGYRPMHMFHRGMELTESWMRWAGLCS